VMCYALLFTSDTFMSIIFVASGSNLARATPQASCPWLISPITRPVDNIFDQYHLSRILLDMNRLLKLGSMVSCRRCSGKSDSKKIHPPFQKLTEASYKVWTTICLVSAPILRCDDPFEPSRHEQVDLGVSYSPKAR
jgi:hypothetical protein